MLNRRYFANTKMRLFSGCILSLLILFSTGFAQEERTFILKPEKSFQVEGTSESEGNETYLLQHTTALINKYAVLVGVSRYNSDRINPLTYTVADVTAIYEVLTDPKLSGFPKSQVYLFTDNTSKKPTALNILSQLNVILQNAGPNDTVLFYFSGHGIEYDGVGYLLPQDTNVNLIDRTGIPLAYIKEMFVKSEAKAQVIILDACHSGVRRDKSIDVADRSEAFDRVQEAFFDAEGRVILSSSAADQNSHEDVQKGHGVYTYYLLEALRGAADRDGNGMITVTEAHTYVEKKVKAWAIEHGFVQRPRIYLNGSADIVLTIGRTFTVTIPTPPAATPTLPTSSPPIIAPIDGAKMVFIPPGSFIMGSPAGRGRSDESPQHEVFLDGYYIDLYEVTNAQYRMFLEATGHPEPNFWNDSRFNQPDQPVVGVSWYDVREYAKWVGRSLPTEAEWEKAARGPDQRLYPWGNEWEQSRVVANLTSVYKYPSDGSPYGVKGLEGNVAEWVADWYQKDYYMKPPSSAWRNPRGPEKGMFRVYRGASWAKHDENEVRAARRHFSFPNLKFNNVGFRLVKRITSSDK